MKMKIREIIVGVLITIGILLMVGAVGNGDYYGELTTIDGIHIGAGLLSVAVGVAIELIGEEMEEK